MRCEEIQEQVSMLVDGELGMDESAVAFSHLSECLECRSFMASLLKTTSVMHSMALPDPDASLRPSVLAAARSSLDPGKRGTAIRRSQAGFLNRRVSVSYAAVFIIAVLVGAWSLALGASVGENAHREFPPESGIRYTMGPRWMSGATPPGSGQ